MRRVACLTVASLAFGLAFSAQPGTAECTASGSAYEIGQEEAAQLYDCVKAELIERYSKVAGVPGVPAYRDWLVVSTAPLVSATHGSLMVNHIANPEAAPLYTQWEAMAGEKFPPGAILAKESIRITSAGAVRAGPLFLMEKADAGASPETDDWIYTRILPNGRVQRTLGTDGGQLMFCHDCHAATIDAYDAMFFPPEEYRITVE